ncbi:MAG: helix-turn-helix transcriptional regulator [Gammaproteobacteria bacterium]
MSNLSSEFLTTRQLAELLHIKERRVYDLAASGQVPCSRVTGKLLFPRRAVEEWIARNSSGGAETPKHRAARVVLGSQDPLLKWALRASGTELATLFEGSLNGLDRFGQGEGLAAGLHLFDADTGAWNVPAVRSRFEYAPVVLVEFAWRERGFILSPGQGEDFSGLSDLANKRVARRQPTAGSQVLLSHLLDEAGIDAGAISWTETAGTETELAIAVLEGKADVAFGLRAAAQQLKLHFVPHGRERFDLLVDRAAWFDPPFQELLSFFRCGAFREKAGTLGGYDISGLGTVHFNGS